MLPCATCAYRSTVPGDSHLSCEYDWIKWVEGIAVKINVASTAREKLFLLAKVAGHPAAHPVLPRVERWYTFPFNYDPLWGPDTCPGHATISDPESRAPRTPLTDIFRILGPRL